MKRLILSAAALSMLTAVYAENKFDAPGEIIAEQYNQFRIDPSKLLLDKESLPFSTEVISRSETKSIALVVLADGIDRSQIETLGFDVNAASRSVLLVEGTMNAIIDLAESDLVKSVSFPQTYDGLLDYGRKFTGVDKIHEGSSGLPQAFTGKGIITGIFDTGFYPDHINFKDAEGICRITNFWNYTSTDGTKVTHYDTPEKVVNIPSGTDTPTSSHGTHTLGCMAGFCYPNVKSMANYDQRENVMTTVNRIKYPNGMPIPFYGMSKESEIIAAAGSLTDANIMAGIQQMADYIAASGKPGVINLSIGSLIGPRDGSDAFTVFLDEIAETIPVCVAAGNDGDSNKSLTGAEFNTFLSIDDPTGQSTGAIDLWSSDDKPFEATFVIYDKTKREVVFEHAIGEGSRQTILGNSSYSNVTIKDTSFDQAFSDSYLMMQPKVLQTNNRYRLFIQYSLKPATDADEIPNTNLVAGLKIKAAEGSHVDLGHRATKGSVSLSSLGVSGWQSGNSDMSISSMACGKNTITVGAWNTRNSWGILPNNTYYYSSLVGLELDDIAGYSSYGLLCDGRRKPDFTAPGTGVISSVSTPGEASLDSGSAPCATYTSGTRKDSWGLMQGTSMATPIVAGAVALWLEADPTLTPAEIREIAMTTCMTDSYTENPETNSLRWGKGKFDALAGIKKVLNGAGINDITADAGDKFQLTAIGENCWDIYVPGANRVDARIFNLSGQTVNTATAQGDQLTLEASNVTPGIYILNVNGSHSTRIVIR